MNTTIDNAYKLGCGRLLFEHGALCSLGAEASRLGNSAYILIGKNACRAVGDTPAQSLQKFGVPYDMDVYEGACSEEKARAVAALVAQSKRAVIIGIGGGRIMDLCKTVASIACLPVITVPTICATCAAFTPLSVIYKSSGECRGTWYFQREVDAVLCDLDILLKQPPRFLAAGMLDAMAKHIEIAHNKHLTAKAGQPAATAMLLAKSVYDDLLALGRQALENPKGEATKRCVFHALITTGVISGMARGQYQSALAHALYEAIRTLYPVKSKPFLHGEVVALGLLYQEYYLENHAQARTLKNFMRAAGMPLSLSQIGVATDEAALEHLCAQAPLPAHFLDGERDYRRSLDILSTYLT